MTAASVSAGTGVLRRCDLNDLSETAVESKSNRSRNHGITRVNFSREFASPATSQLATIPTFISGFNCSVNWTTLHRRLEQSYNGALLADEVDS